MLYNSVHMLSYVLWAACTLRQGHVHMQAENLTQPCYAELAAMRSLYAAVQLLLSRLLDFVASAQRAPAADSEGSAGFHVS